MKIKIDRPSTCIPHAMLEKMYSESLDLSKREFRVLLYLIRQMHGWHIEVLVHTYYKLAFDLCLDRSDFRKTIRGLIEKGILSVTTHRQESSKGKKQWKIIRFQPESDWIYTRVRQIKKASDKVKVKERGTLLHIVSSREEATKIGGKRPPKSGGDLPPKSGGDLPPIRG